MSNKGKFRIGRVLFTLTLIFLVILISASWYFYNIAVHFDTKKEVDRFAQAIEQKRFNPDKFNTLKIDSLWLDSPSGYKISAHLIYNPDTTANTIIVNHGLSASQWYMVPWVELFIDKGFNVMIHDFRDHGKSGGDFVSYGYWEKKDVEILVTWLRNKYPDGILGMYGESMGAATALQHAGLLNKQNDVSFYIADSPYSDLRELFSIRIREDYRMPPFPLLNLGGMIAGFRNGFNFSDVSPINAINGIETPILFIHGTKDMLVPNWMSREMYSKDTLNRSLYLVEGAAHALTFSIDKITYSAIIDKFLTKTGVEFNKDTVSGRSLELP